ncbi:MAG TPA: glycosyltransferase family 2 protein [Acidobacteriaceae bacterium]|nr:glycosyltransferase family 2 protein [Acidobacteriaceae bacterium]
MSSFAGPAETLRLSVMVPARNEEDVLQGCLESLVRQSEEDFRLGTHWELLVADDHSTDCTRAIAEHMEGVTVLSPDEPPQGWTGKANALWTAARRAQGEWFLFTDADTVHEPGDLKRALEEAGSGHLALLSYSPRQRVSGFWQRALMPVVFSELALAYPPGKVSDPASRVAAANGQFLMVRRNAYFEVGGHSAVPGSLLEDLDLAALFKRRRYSIGFRYAPDALSTRMYRSAGAMVEGWTKNLARLFAQPLLLAAWRMLDLLLVVALPLLVWALFSHPLQRYALLAVWAHALWRFFSRVAGSNFPAADCALALFGMPLFCMLLLRSWFDHVIRRRVVWKGRQYSTGRI